MFVVVPGVFFADMGYGSTRVCYTKAEADEMLVFGFKLIKTEQLDDGRTKYTLRAIDDSKMYKKKKEVEFEPGTYETPDWM